MIDLNHEPSSYSYTLGVYLRNAIEAWRMAGEYVKDAAKVTRDSIKKAKVLVVETYQIIGTTTEPTSVSGAHLAQTGESAVLFSEITSIVTYGKTNNVPAHGVIKANSAYIVIHPSAVPVYLAAWQSYLDN